MLRFKAVTCRRLLCVQAWNVTTHNLLLLDPFKQPNRHTGVGYILASAQDNNSAKGATLHCRFDVRWAPPTVYGIMEDIELGHKDSKQAGNKVMPPTTSSTSTSSRQESRTVTAFDTYLPSYRERYRKTFSSHAIQLLIQAFDIDTLCLTDCVMELAGAATACSNRMPIGRSFVRHSGAFLRCDLYLRLIDCESRDGKGALP